MAYVLKIDSLHVLPGLGSFARAASKQARNFAGPYLEAHEKYQ